MENQNSEAASNEVVYFEGSPSLRGSMGSLFLFALLGAGLLVGAVVLRSSDWWIPLALSVIAILLVVLPIFIIRTTRYRITSYRIDYERGIFSKSIDTLELWHVDDLKYQQSLLDRILGVCTITVVSSDDTTPELVLQALPNPRPVFESLKQRIITVKRQRGVIKLDNG